MSRVVRQAVHGARQAVCEVIHHIHSHPTVVAEPTMTPSHAWACPVA